MNLFACARFEVTSVRVHLVAFGMLQGSACLCRQQDCAHSQPPHLSVVAKSAATLGGGGGSFAALDLERKIAAICSSRRDWSVIS